MKDKLKEAIKDLKEQLDLQKRQPQFGTAILLFSNHAKAILQALTDPKEDQGLIIKNGEKICDCPHCGEEIIWGISDELYLKLRKLQSPPPEAEIDFEDELQRRIKLHGQDAIISENYLVGWRSCAEWALKNQSVALPTDQEIELEAKKEKSSLGLGTGCDLDT